MFPSTINLQHVYLIILLSVKCLSLKLVFLKSHRQTYTGGKPYECNKCKVAFAQKGNSKAIKEDTLLPRIVDAVQTLNLKAADDDPSCTKALIRTLPLMLDRDPYHA